MLSRAEILFLRGEKKVSRGYAYVLRYRIRAKAKAMQAIFEDPVIQQALNRLSGNCKDPTETCKMLKNEYSKSEEFNGPGGFQVQMVRVRGLENDSVPLAAY
jgi:hypothetical protein